MQDVKQIKIEDYDYNLPDNRIAKYPLPERDSSKLLVYKNGKIESSVFKEIGNFLPPSSVLFFNETKVIQARLQFQKQGGANIEIFCLEPAGETTDYQLSFAQSSPVLWKCLVGNSRRWKDGDLLLNIPIGEKNVVLSAKRLEKNDQYSVIQFSWQDKNLSFASILEAAGEIPLPPYLHRDAEPSDKERYQTVFAKFDGSVAAPTAGLHLTANLIQKLENQGFQFEHLTLHVGAGTFKPVSTSTIGEHQMHSEIIIVSRQTICNLIDALNRPIIPIGTTSMRTLESLYWIGLMLIEEGTEKRDLHLSQWFPYQERKSVPDTKTALEKIVEYLDLHNFTKLSASTALMIAPNYKVRVVKGIITNFHQPKSTLLLLVSALIGEKWKESYQFALNHDFRFLSFGDSCLFLP